jgi:death-on-curing protein
MRHLTLGEVLELHSRIIANWGGAPDILDLRALESAVFQPRTAFGGSDFYPGVAAKAAALCFSLIRNYPFADGHRHVAHAAMETFLVLNGCEIDASVEEQERVVLAMASGDLSRDGLLEWVKGHIRPTSSGDCS